MKHFAKFGIISGAGPMAGALLYEYVIEKFQARGAWRDADFPEILLHNVPFPDMLDGQFENKAVHDVLIDSLALLSRYCDYIYIACQTLHAFLSLKEIQTYKVVSLLELTRQAVADEKQEIQVIASRTSAAFNLHSKGLGRECSYIAVQQSEQAINEILKGRHPNLSWVETIAQSQPVLLGCTEFSVALKHSKAPNLIDPLILAADDILMKAQPQILAEV